MLRSLPRSIFLSLAVAALLPACSSPKKRIAEKFEGLRLDWQTNFAYQANLPERTLDWPTALQELRAHNLKLRQSRTEMTNAQEAVRQVFRDLVPTLNMHAGLSKRIVDLPKVSSDDVTFSVDSLFNIPGVVSFGARLYMTRLYELRAEAATGLVERQLIVDLYKLFWAAQDVQELDRFLANQKNTARAYETVDPFSGQMLMTDTEVRELTSQLEVRTLQERASDLLGNHEYRWKFSTNGLPDLPYDREPLPLNDTNRVAQLQLLLAAIELEAARAELAGMKLRYWPELNIFVTGPPIYQRSFGETKWWDANELRMTADAFWWIDTRGYISRQVRQTKRQRDIQRSRLHAETLALQQRLLVTQDLVKTTSEKEQELRMQLAVLEAVPPAQNFAALQKYALDYQAAVDQLRQVRRDLAELKSLLWFVDERSWAELAPIQTLAVARQ